MKHSDKTLIVLIVVLLPLSLLCNLNVMELRAEEPRRAIVALEMFLTGNYLVPKINGVDYYNKPPLFNWLIVLGFHLFHSFSEWVVRLPSLLSFLLTGAFHYFFSRKYLNKATALLASLFFLTAADIFFYATINSGEIDLFYSLLVYLQVISIFLFFEKQQWLYLFLCSYVFTGLGILTKGPPSLLFQALTLLGWFIYNKQIKKLLSWQHVLGIVFCVLISGSYFYLYAQQADVAGMLVRLTKEATQRSGLEGSFLKTVTGTVFFPVLLIRLLLPWSLLVLFWLRKDFFSEISSNRLVVFCVLFIAVNIPIYWFTGELKNRYIYMFFPFITTILAYFFIQRANVHIKTYRTIESILVFAILFGSALFLLLPFLPFTSSIPYIWPKAILFCICGVLISFYAYKNVSQRMLTVILFLVLARFALACFYFPAMMTTDNLQYRQQCSQILAITKNEPVYWADAPFYFNSAISIGPIHLQPKQHHTAALIAYQIPYYISRGNKQVMRFTSQIEAGKLYITPEAFAKDKPVDVLYRLRDNWLQKELWLVRGK